MNWTPYLIGWIGLAIGVIGLALYRKLVARGEDDFIHVSGDGAPIAKQKTVAHKLEVVDLWGKILSVICAVLGICLLAAYLYVGWLEGAKLAP